MMNMTMSMTMSMMTIDDDDDDDDEPPVHQRAPMSAKIKGLPHEGSICCLAGLRKLTGCSHAC